MEAKTAEREARILKAQAPRRSGGLGARSVMEATFLVDRQIAAEKAREPKVAERL